MAELLRGSRKNRAGLIHLQRRQRIFALARRFERIAAGNFLALQVAGLAGDAELVFGAVVERLEVGIAERPIGERGILRDDGRPVALDGLRAGAEIVLVQAPRERAVVHGAAARLVAVVLVRGRVGARSCIGPPGDGRALDVGAQVLALEVAQLVELEVRGLEARAALEPDHLHAGLAELGRQHAAGGAHADDDHISLFGRHGF